MKGYESIIERTALEEKETWNNREGRNVEMSKDMLEFLKDIEKICKKHNMTLSHEDTHGSFEVTEYDEDNLQWLAWANDAR
ncbi:hypothetical protein [Oceanobacillus sp. FSL H7-0719]|uniref:hypothetical protein n=1 Tax=Oceanobacillus sp. FSL H7-0719 TaxID=2954507 RepID=UPI00324B8E8B